MNPSLPSRFSLPRRLGSFVAALFVVIGSAWWRASDRPAEDRREVRSAGESSENATTSAPVSDQVAGWLVGENVSGESAFAPRDPRWSLATAWAREEQPAIRAFSTWAERYAEAAPAERVAMEADGIRLARDRRAALKDLIESDPAAALAAAVPWRMRQSLPATVTGEIEERVSGMGSFSVIGVTPRPGTAVAKTIVHEVAIAGRMFEAHVYGRREGQRTTSRDSLHGIVVDGKMAVLESPLRLLEPGEPPSPEKTVRADLRTVHRAAAARMPVMESGDQVYYGCCYAELSQNEQQWALDYGGPPAVGGGEVSPYRARALDSRLLIMIVRFAGGTPNPLTPATASARMSGQIIPWLSSQSFQQCGFAPGGIVVTNELILPRTRAEYIAMGNSVGPATVLTDARILARAANVAHDTNLFHFDAVFFEDGTFDFAGRGTVGGKGLWMQNSPTDPFPMGVFGHEFGHNLGMNHAGLWTRPSGSTNPLDPAGAFVDYGSVFDVMGSGDTQAGTSPQVPNHFSAHFKYLLGWLPAANVLTIDRTSGPVPIYTHDGGGTINAGRKYAIRIPASTADAAAPAGQRDTWIETRTLFNDRVPANSKEGVIVQWGDENGSPRGSGLIDTHPETSGFEDAILRNGEVMADPWNAAPGTNRITIAPTAGGGAGVDKFVNVAITTPNADLVSLNVSPGALTPAFSPAVARYTVNVPSGTQTFTVTPAAAVGTAIQAQVNGAGFVSLNSGAPAALAIQPGQNVVEIRGIRGNWRTTWTIVVSTPEQPEISVELPAGSTGNTVEFGTLTIGTGTSRTLTVRNTGAGALTLAKPVLSAGEVADYDVNADAMATRVGPGQTTTLTVSYAPEMIGQRDATLRVDSNDSDEASTFITLRGVGQVTPPALATTVPSAAEIAATGAVLGGNVTFIAGSPIIERGVVWSTAPAPTISSNKVADGNGAGTFSQVVRGMPVNTVIHVRAYATNSAGTGYGNEVTFTTLAVRNSNADLSALDLSSGLRTPGFAPGVVNYNVNVANSVTGITLTPEVAYLMSTVQVRINGGAYTAIANGTPSFELPLPVGISTVNVLVTAENPANTRTYTLTVSRLAPAPSAVPPGAISWWKAEGNGTDAIGTNHGTLNGVNFATGKVGQAFSFAGNGSIDCGNAATVQLSNSATLEAWVKTTSTDFMYLFNKASAYGLLMADGKIGVSDHANSSAVLYNRVIADGQWHHVAYAISPATATLYLDGVALTSFPTFATVNQLSSLRMGDGFSGQIDEPTIYNRPLGPGEILAIFQAGAAGKSSTVPELTVEEPTGTNLPNGGTVTFSSTPIGTETFRFITVRNTGSSPLQLTGLRVTGPGAGEFTINSATLAANVGAGGSMSFSVAFSPIATGTRTATLQLESTDSDENPFTIALTGTGAPPLGNDASLSSLTTTAGALTPAFSPDTLAYTVAAVPFTTSSITITPTKTQAGGNVYVSVNGGAYTFVLSGSASVPLALRVGSNDLDIRVAAENGSTIRIYQITVTREVAPGAITWGPVEQWFGENPAQVLNNGVRHAAVCFVASDTTVNGVRFDRPAVPSGATSVTFANNSPVTVTSEFYQVQTNAPAPAGFGAYGALVGSGNFHRLPGTINIGGLTAGQEYQVQLFMPYWDNLWPTDFGTVNGVEARLNCGRTTGTTARAQFVVGTFTATAATVSISYESAPVSGTWAGLAAVSVRRLSLSSNADLAALATSAGALAPAFSPNVLGYNLSVPNSVASVTVTPTAAQAGASLAVNNLPVVSGSASSAIPLNVGTNSISIPVTAEDASTVKTYTLTITRAPVNLAGATTQVAMLPGGALQVSITDAPAGTTLVLQRSPDLVTWTTIETIATDGVGSVSATDSAPPLSRAFYRFAAP